MAPSEKKEQKRPTLAAHLHARCSGAPRVPRRRLGPPIGRAAAVAAVGATPALAAPTRRRAAPRPAPPRPPAGLDGAAAGPSRSVLGRRGCGGPPCRAPPPHGGGGPPHPAPVGTHRRCHRGRGPAL